MPPVGPDIPSVDPTGGEAVQEKASYPFFWCSGRMIPCHEKIAGEGCSLNGQFVRGRF